MTGKFTRFDATVAAVMLGLLAAIGLTILSGDHIGAQIERYSPTGVSASTAPVTLTFGEVMDWDTVIAHMEFSPPLQGDYHSSNKSLRFSPAEPLTPGAEYAVTLRAGSSSASGRQVLDELSFSFRIRSPRVAYLSPADSVPQNIWLADPLQPDSPQQVTFSPGGILNFDVSPDGTHIAFAERGEGGTANIKLLDLATGSLQQLTHCSDSDCDTPVWRPDGSLIAYHRIDLNSDLSQVGVSPTRIWLIDMTASPPSERSLFSDNQMLGFAPQWSANSQKIALFDNKDSAIVVYSLANDKTTMISQPERRRRPGPLARWQPDRLPAPDFRPG